MVVLTVRGMDDSNDRNRVGPVDYTDHVDDDTVVIDCDRCQVRGDACSECVVSVLLGAPPELAWDGAERHAVDVLADVGMVPRLRLVAGEPEARQRRDGRRAG